MFWQSCAATKRIQRRENLRFSQTRWVLWHFQRLFHLSRLFVSCKNGQWVAQVDVYLEGTTRLALTGIGVGVILWVPEWLTRQKGNGDHAHARFCSDFTPNLSQQSHSGDKSAGLGVWPVPEIVMSRPENESPSHRLDGQRFSINRWRATPMLPSPFILSASRHACCSRRHWHFVSLQTVFVLPCNRRHSDILRENLFSPVGGLQHGTDKIWASSSTSRPWWAEALW